MTIKIALPTKPNPCPTDCGFRISTETLAIWQCTTCQQLWDHPDHGTRTWSPEQQAHHRNLWAQALESGHLPSKVTGSSVRRTP